MPTVLLFDLIEPVLTDHREGKPAEVAVQYAHILLPLDFESRQCGLRACKSAKMAGAMIRRDMVRHPRAPLHPATCAELLALAADENRWCSAGANGRAVGRSPVTPASRSFRETNSSIACDRWPYAVPVGGVRLMGVCDNPALRPHIDRTRAESSY